MASTEGHTRGRRLHAEVLEHSAISLGTATHLTQTYHSGLETYLVLAAVQARAAEDHLTQNLGVIDLTLLNLLENDAADPAIELARAVRHAPYLRALSPTGPGGCIIVSSNPANVGQLLSFDDSLPLVLPALVIAVVLGGATLLYLRRVAAEYERADQATRLPATQDPARHDRNPIPRNVSPHQPVRVGSMW